MIEKSGDRKRYLIGALVAFALIGGGCVPEEVRMAPTRTPEPTPTCVPMTRKEWHAKYQGAADAHWLEYQKLQMMEGGPLDNGLIRVYMAQEMTAALEDSETANNFSPLCGFPFPTETPTPTSMGK